MAAQRLRKKVSAAGDQYALFKKRAYRLIVVAEVIAIGVGSGVLGHRHEGRGLINTWIALVVGIHFLALARFGDSSYLYGVGLMLVAIAAVCAIGYASAGWTDKVLTLAVTVPSASTLYLSSWRGVASAKSKPATPAPLGVSGH